jgi:hypothetical protein
MQKTAGLVRIVIFLMIIGGTLKAVAQEGIKPIKPAKRKACQNLDYQQMGAPMPALKYIKFPDPTYNTIVIAMRAKPDTTAKADKKLKRRKKSKASSDVQYLTNQDFKNGANLFVMIFNPNCSHCEEETQLLEKNIHLFKQSKILLMTSPVVWESMDIFTKSMHTDDYKAITVGVDSSDFISKVFIYASLPQINIYDHSRKLIKTFSGDVPIDSLKVFIE